MTRARDQLVEKMSFKRRMFFKKECREPLGA